MCRHSDTLRGAHATTKTRFTGRKQPNELLRSKVVVFPSFPERGLTGENARANAVSRRALSPVKIKIPVATADMRRHSDTLRAANAATKEGVNGGENARASVLRSEGVVVPVHSHAILITLTDISSPVAADSLHRLIIAPARAAAVFASPVGGRLGLGSVGVMPSLVMTI